MVAAAASGVVSKIFAVPPVKRILELDSAWPIGLHGNLPTFCVKIVVYRKWR